MATILEFTTLKLKVSDWQQCTSVPFLASIDIQQNRMVSQLDKDDPLELGYGAIPTIYPYVQQNIYTRELEEKEIKVVVLENNYLKAVFVPSLGGKLWSLYDKVAEKDLLYTNDVIRPSNLATRNAWVSGGVEWNIGIVGHSPFTCEQLFVATLEEEGTLILRMYEYERIRSVIYQMDFFLPEDSRFLLCRMKIVNPNTTEVPMYWWSNIAVPELEKGRIVVNADSAYKNTGLVVSRVPVPIEKGVDISYPHDLPKAVDYFFDIPKDKRKFITHLSEEGYGLVQLSTNRLQGRKLFVWGQQFGSKRWQGFLTEKAGDYIEIQAGLAKTQYGCIHMESLGEWEWLEAYGALQIDAKLMAEDWHTLRNHVNEKLDELLPDESLEEKLETTKETIGNKKGELKEKGSLFAAIELHRREKTEEKLFNQVLDFGQAEGNAWVNLLETGTLGIHRIEDNPEYYMMNKTYLEALEKAVKEKDKGNWYTWYHLGLFYLVNGATDKAKMALETSFSIEKSTFAAHALAFTYRDQKQIQQSIDWMKQAILLRKEDIGLIKDGIGLLMEYEVYATVEEIIQLLPEKIKTNTRIRFCLAYAYAKLGKKEASKQLLFTPNKLEIEDMREGEISLSMLWELLQEGESKKEPLPFEFDFRML